VLCVERVFLQHRRGSSQSRGRLLGGRQEESPPRTLQLSTAEEEEAAGEKFEYQAEVSRRVSIRLPSGRILDRGTFGRPHQRASVATILYT
jgi:hypothetical protein